MARLVTKEGANGETLYALYDPQSGIQELTPQEAEQFSKSRGERYQGAVGDAGQDALAGAAEFGAGGQGGQGVLGAIGNAAAGALNPLGAVMDTLGMNPVADVSRSIAGQNDERQAIRGQIDPMAAAAGGATVLAAELAIPGGPAARAGRIGRNVPVTPANRTSSMVDKLAPLIEGGGNTGRAVMDTAGRAVDSIPVVGPVVRDVVDAGAGALARRGETARARNLSAAATENPNRYRPGQMSTDELTDYAGDLGELHPAIRAKLDAPSAAAHKDATDLIADIENAEAGRGGGELTDSLNNMQAQSTREFNRRIGLDQNVMPDNNVLGDHLTDIGQQLNDNRAQVQGNVDLDGLVDELTESAETQYNMPPDAQRALDKALKDIDAFSDDMGLASAENVGVIESRLNDAIEKAAKASDPTVSDILSEVREKISQRLERVMTPEQRALDRDLRQKWALTREAVMSPNAVGNDGVNPRAMYSALTRKHHLSKTGRNQDPFLKYLETVRDVLGARKPQTGARNQAALQQLLKR